MANIDDPGARVPAAVRSVGLGLIAAGLIALGLALSPVAAEETTAGGDRATELPVIEVVTPSPVTKPPRRAASSAQGAVARLPAGEPEPLLEPPPGTLVIADDAFAAVTVATGREIAATHGPTLTDTLQTKPGISGTTFAPGANRPIIRGLDSYRVRTEENGIGTHDVAALSEDHAVPIDPNAADRIEVVRGPATLRYGSGAIGGVVSVENERIPTVIPKGGARGALSSAVTSVDEGKDGSFKATAGSGAVAVHADGFWRDADDYGSPRGTVANSFVESRGGALGASRIGAEGFVGISFARIESLYGIPGEEAEEGAAPRIDMVQNKVLAKGEWRVRGAGIDAIRVWFGASDYRHNELAIHDPGAGGTFEVGSRFTNTEQEARVELQHQPVGTALGETTGVIGTHWGHRRTRGQSFEGESLLEPAETDSLAAFWFEELTLMRNLRLQAAARIEHTIVDGRGWQDFAEDPGDPDHFLPTTFAGEKSFTPAGASLGLLYRLPVAVVARLTGQSVERAPDAAELFSKGMHEATGTFEVGNPDLGVERATTAEIGLKKAAGAVRFDASAYATWYDGFIYRQLTDRACGPEAEAGGAFHCGVAGGGGDGGHDHAFDLAYFQQRDATFYGAELSVELDVAPVWRGLWGIDGQYDVVRAAFESGENVPRIPPHRLGGGLYYRDTSWFARAAVLHAFEQDRIGLNEIATPGYTLISAELSFTVRHETVAGIVPVMTLGIKGENLADDEVLNHASFKRREDVLLPGASVRLFGAIKLN